MRVLVADDSRTSRLTLSRLLESWGYEVVPCADGEEAWAILKEADAPRIALLDWVMPKIDGIEVCRRLRAQRRDACVFVYLVTGRGARKDLLEGLEAGADDYLVKPVEPAELRVRLRNGRRVVELHEQLLGAQEAMRTQAMIDPLTGAWNRRAFTDMAVAELARSSRAGSASALLLIDLDHFKQINDTFGHQGGDAVLVEVVRRVQSTLRVSDCVARYGGEEFVVLLPDSTGPGAWTAAERVRREISRRPVVFAARPIAVTASIGVAPSSADEPLDEIIARADRALYRAKHAGRDRALLAEPAALDRRSAAGVR